MRFDHAGIATEDASKLASLFETLFEADVAHEETFGGMRVVFVDLGNGYLELLEPREGGTIAEYLDRHGSGIHHLAFETPDVEGALETAKDLDVTPVDEEPRPGAWGHDVAFLHPDDTGGILVEFVEH